MLQHKKCTMYLSISSQNSGTVEVLLHTCEGGSRELELVRMPATGYTTDYLKAVIHTAKLYIRPLQTNLGLEQCSSDSDVSYILLHACTIYNNDNIISTFLANILLLRICQKRFCLENHVHCTLASTRINTIQNHTFDTKTASALYHVA